MTVPPVARRPAIQRRSTDVEGRASQLERDRLGATVSFRDQHDVDPNPIDGQHYLYDAATGLMLPIARQCQFIQAGAITVNAAPPADLIHSGIITRVHARLGTAGSTATTVTLAMNGAVIVTLVIPANATTADAVASNAYTGVAGDFAPRAVRALVDRLVVAVTVAGTNALDLSGWVAL